MAKTKHRKRARKRRGSPRPRAIEVALAGLAHDIRTPLTGILALSDLLQSSDLPSARARLGRGYPWNCRPSGATHDGGCRCRQSRRNGAGAARRTVFATANSRIRWPDRWRRERMARLSSTQSTSQRPAPPRQRRRGAVAQCAGKSDRQRGEVHRARQRGICRVVGGRRPWARAPHVHSDRQRHGHYVRRSQAAVPSVCAGEQRGGKALWRRGFGSGVRQTHRRGHGRRSGK